MVKKLQPKYGAADGVDPPHDVRWEIDGTEAREGIDPAKVQHNYASGAGLWDKMLSFEDKMVFLVLKTIASKMYPCL